MTFLLGDKTYVFGCTAYLVHCFHDTTNLPITMDSGDCVSSEEKSESPINPPCFPEVVMTSCYTPVIPQAVLPMFTGILKTLKIVEAEILNISKLLPVWTCEAEKATVSPSSQTEVCQ